MLEGGEREGETEGGREGGMEGGRGGEKERWMDGGREGGREGGERGKGGKGKGDLAERRIVPASFFPPKSPPLAKASVQWNFIRICTVIIHTHKRAHTHIHTFVSQS